MTLNRIYETVQADLIKVEDSLSFISKIDFAWLAQVLDYSLKNAGKRIRPALVLLAGKFHEYSLTYLLPMAISVELMHTATLIHDDAIDKSSVRRSRPTINKLWGAEKAVLLGDYLFAKAGEAATETQSLRVIMLFSQTLGVISSGELNQAINAFNLHQSHENYIKRIAGKTASLFALATESGAILSHAPEAAVAVLRDYGYNLGIAFQISDDILDFIGTEEELGKPVGSDLLQGTFTLPAMLTLELYPDDNPVRDLFTRPMSDEEKFARVKQAIGLVRNSPIVERCHTAALEYRDKACEGLKELPDNATRQALIDLADYVISRRR